MTIIRVIDEVRTVLGTLEADHVPAVGDRFMWETAGPFLVKSRTWDFPAEYNDVAHRVTLFVEREAPV